MANRKVEIRGVQGWTENEKCDAREVATGEKCYKEKGHEIHGFPEKQLSPEEALAKVKQIAAEGKVTLAIDEAQPTGGFVIQWSAERVGFGEVTIKMNADGSVQIDDECMGSGFVKEVLCALVDKANTGP